MSNRSLAQILSEISLYLPDLSASLLRETSRQLGLAEIAGVLQNCVQHCGPMWYSALQWSSSWNLLSQGIYDFVQVWSTIFLTRETCRVRYRRTVSGELGRLCLHKYIAIRTAVELSFVLRIPAPARLPTHSISQRSNQLLAFCLYPANVCCPR